MLKVLLVDDEERSIRHLISSVSWYSLGLEIVSTSSNGLEALEYIEKNHIDILITDIRMPLMDGLELSQRLRDMNKDIFIILLTGYADFDYARRGIDLGVTAYCLKPIDVNDITETLRKITNIGYERMLSETDALLDIIEDGDKTHVQRAFYELGLGGESVYVAASLGVHNIERELAATISCKVGKHKYLYFSNENFDRLAAERIISTAKLKSGIAMPKHPIAYSNLRNVVMDLMAMTFQYFINGRPCLSDSLINTRYADDVLKHIESIREDTDKVKKYIFKLSQLDFSQCFNIRSFFRFANNLLSMINVRNASKLFVDFDSYEQLASEYTNANLVIKDIAESIKTDSTEDVQASLGSDRFIKIINYLNENFDKNISLKTAANNLHLNASYLSSLIKSETGLTYTQYITELRINKAKELLNTTKLSLAEISESVGFNDYFYFIKKFKREVGVSPGKYIVK